VRPKKSPDGEERIARVDRMMKELAAVEKRAAELAAEIRERTRRVADELAGFKGTTRRKDSN
jgi:hypothetical protein